MAAPAVSCPSRKAFWCNVCGAKAECAAEALLSREAPSCPRCGSNRRYRTLIHALSLEVFGSSLVLPDFPTRKDVRGVGLSDSSIYAGLLARKFDYTNTFFHAEPRLDICDLEGTSFGELDFLLASDVFEHVAPPVDRAFRNARALLRAGGVFLFSVPYDPGGETREHFPDLFEYEIARTDRKPVLHNRTREGVDQYFADLVFHGGDGTTLEMRLFSLADLDRHFRAAGFESPRLLDQSFPEFGIDCSTEPWSIPMVARAL